jgi:hypothetical protein
VDAILNKNWQTTVFTVDPGINLGGTVITDLYAQWEDCDKDDLFRFSSDGNIIDDEGALKCDASDPQTVTRKWSANSTGTIITLTGDDGAENWTIETVTATTLKVSYSGDLMGDGINRKATMTATAK